VDAHFKQNKVQVIETLEEFISNQFKDLLIKEDYNAIFEEMESVNRIKEILNGMNIKVVYSTEVEIIKRTT
jgi:prephenate dehydrogenase